jgi:oligoribonuclease NrnB/cAMP/cGMP phosphodiesterase (DHH superfamily)
MYQITHDDLDGYGCRLIAEKMFPHIHVEHTDYNNINATVIDVLSKEPDILIISDIWKKGSLGFEWDKALYQFPGKLYVFDHHESAEEDQNSLRLAGHTVINGEGKSATKHMAEYFNIDMPGIDLINKYDLTGTNKGDAGKLNVLFEEVGYEGIYECLHRDPFTFNASELQIIENVLNLYDDYFQLAKDTLQVHSHGDHTVAYIESTNGYNYILKKLLETYDVAILVNREKETVSYRTNTLDVANKIAKTFGGGGHPYAAGSPLIASPDKIITAAKVVLNEVQ